MMVKRKNSAGAVFRRSSCLNGWLAIQGVIRYLQTQSLPLGHPAISLGVSCNIVYVESVSVKGW